MEAISPRIRSSLFLSLCLGLGLAACGGMSQQSPPDGGSNHEQTCHSGSNACDTCGDEFCCPELQACADNASCESAIDCAVGCGSDTACLNNCSAEYSSGVEDANALSSCVNSFCSEACAPPAFSPVGTWSIDVAFSATSCGGPSNLVVETLTFSQAANGYNVVSGNATITGTTSCTASGCAVSLVMDFVVNSTSYQQTLNLTLSSNGSVTGSSYETWSSCSATATVTGAKE